MYRVQSKKMELIHFPQKSKLRPLPVNERSALFEKHGLRFQADTSSKAAIQFIEDQDLSLEECMQLSEELDYWLCHQNIELLLSMQAMDTKFIPVLDLTKKRVGGHPSHENPGWKKPSGLDMLKEANEKGLVFQAHFDFNLSAEEAEEIQSAMEHSRLIGLIYTSNAPLKSTDAHDCIQSALEKCNGLQQAIITGNFLPLLINTSVSEIKLVIENKNKPDLDSLSRLFKQGSVRAFDVRACDVKVLSEIADLIKQNNTLLSPSHCIHSLKIGRGPGYNLSHKDYFPVLLQKVFAIPHLWSIELPELDWLKNIYPKDLVTAVYASALESITIEEILTPTKKSLWYPDSSRISLEDFVARLNAILKLKRQREHTVLVAVSKQFAPIATTGFGDANNPQSRTASEFLRTSAGLPIEELEKILVGQLEGMSVGSALACVNNTTRKAANGAREAFDTAHREEVHELAGMNQFDRALSNAKNSVTALWRAMGN